MNNLKRILALLIVCVLTLSGCGGSVDELIKNKSAAVNIPSKTEKIDLADEFKTVAENDKYILSLGTKELNISITDRKSGKAWYTNHPDNGNDTIALADSLELLKAQLQINYYDANGNYGTMNSYTDCVALGQYEIFPIKNGISVAYTLGDMTRTIDDVPQKISNKRFAEKLYNNLSKKERSMLKQLYDYFEDEDIWAINSKGRKYYQAILELMDKAGYTDEDLKEDNRKFGLSVSSTSKIGFTVTVQYTLTDNGLSVCIPCDKIKYNSDYPPFDIILLPNFGAQRVSDETKNGFLLMPDGSGALMNFDSSLSSEYYYEAPVYGYDEVVTLRKNTNNIQSNTVSLPVFGISDGTSGIIACITDGAANASIIGMRSGRNSHQYTAYASFSALNMDYVKLNGSTSVTTTTVFQEDIYSGSFSVEYMTVDKPSYVDMAKVLRDVLEKRGLLPKAEGIKNELPFYLETIGGAWGAKSLLGFSYSGVVAATTYEQNTIIADKLSELGVKNIKLKLLGWSNNGMYGDCAADIKLISALGSKSGFKKLQEYCQKKGVELYPDAALIYGGKGSGLAEADMARTLDSRVVEAVQRMSLPDDLPHTTAYAYSPVRLLSLADKFLASCKKLGIRNVSVGDNGSKLYSDYNDTLDRQFDRAESEKYVARQTAAIAKSADSVMINTGNLYSLAYAHHITNVATDNSWMLCEDEAVPFMQIVLHGRTQLSSRALNLETDFEREILRLAEYGVAPLYQLSFEETTVLSPTKYSENFSSCYTDWVSTAAESWTRLEKVLSAVQSAQITDHFAVAKEVYCTKYDNGASVYVNYSEKDYSDSTVNVPARDFVQVREG